MSESKHGNKVGAELIISILREAGKPLTTRQVQEEVKKIHNFCIASNVVSLNYMRIRGTIKGKHENKTWIWWVDD